MGCVVSGVGAHNWLTKLKLKTDVPLRNYYTPLTIKVEELIPTDKLCNVQVRTTLNPVTRRGNR